MKSSSKASSKEGKQSKLIHDEGEQKGLDVDEQKVESLLPETQTEKDEESPEKKNEKSSGENEKPAASSDLLMNQPNLSKGC